MLTPFLRSAARDSAETKTIDRLALFGATVRSAGYAVKQTFVYVVAEIVGQQMRA
jgi:hypothetical protein